MRRLVLLAALIAVGWTAPNAARAGSPSYLTLKSNNVGSGYQVERTTYAWGWFGATPRGWGKYCYKGYYGDCWFWYYK